MRRLLSAVVAATFIVSMLQGGIPAARAGGGGTASYYLALGTSLAVGYQPGKGETTRGYVDDLWRSIRQQIPGLTIRNVGCPGETTPSMISGKHSLCHYAAGSQLDAAVSFLEAHPGQVAFITVDVGAEELVGRCLDHTGLLIDRACAVDLRPGMQARLTHIVDALSAAAGPGVPIVGMKYYDPFLGLWDLVPGGHALARADQRAWSVLNTGLTSAYVHAGAAVADVAATFRIRDFKHTVEVPRQGRIPLNVALECRWTWFCSKKSLGDPHPNRTGYRKIARTFDRKLQGLLP